MKLPSLPQAGDLAIETEVMGGAAVCPAGGIATLFLNPREKGGRKR